MYVTTHKSVKISLLNNPSTRIYLKLQFYKTVITIIVNDYVADSSLENGWYEPGWTHEVPWFIPSALGGFNIISLAASWILGS